MKIGIVLHSYTGNTYSVAEKISEKLLSDGHMVDLHRLKLPEDWKPGFNGLKFESLPDLEGYDVMLFGSPVEAFSLSSAMKAYFSQVGSLRGKRVALLVTHQFPFAWLGGNRAIRQMKGICEGKGAEVMSSCVIDWSNRKRDVQIKNCISQFSKAFSGQ